MGRVVKSVATATALMLSSSFSSPALAGEVKVEFPWFQGAGTDPTDVWFRQAVDEFNKKYDGKYEAVVEFLPGQDNYNEKMRVLFSANSLPPIVSLQRDPRLAKSYIDSGKLADLMPSFSASTEWKSLALEDSVALNTINGKLLAAPEAWVTPVGIFYNKEHFAEAGIKEFPQDWSAWWAALDALKAAGHAPLSLHTKDTGWSAILVFEALLAASSDGQAFLNAMFPESFEKPVIVNALKELARLFKYSTPDAIGGNYPLAANNFVNGQTSMMPNGPWMIGMFKDSSASPQGFYDKVGVALYPGNFAISDAGLQYGDWAVVNTYPEEVQTAAIALVEFMRSDFVVRQRVLQLGSTAPKLKLTDEERSKVDPLALEVNDLLVKTNGKILPNYQGMWTTAIQNEVIEQDLPSLALGNMTAEDFAKRMTEASKK